MRTDPDPTPSIHHNPFRFPPSPPPSADATPPPSPHLLPGPDTPRRRIRDMQTARKVADSLQLFRESEGGPTSGPAPAKRRFTTSHPNDAVEEARYEFVKRADWSDRETAALRREQSSTALENVGTCESIDSQSKDPVSLFPLTRDPPFSDPSHWRKDTTIRGRPRRRASDITPLEPQPSSPSSSPITVPQSPCIRPRSRAYPPSPSPSRSPTDRIPPLALYNSAIDSVNVTGESHLPEPSDTYLTNLNRFHSRSPTPTHISPHASPIAPLPMLPSPTRSFSPWSTDDESAWETSSLTSDISTSSGTSEHPLSFPHVADALIDPLDEGEKIQASLAHKSEDDAGSYGSNLWNADSLDMVYGESEESLPHIPLRPFRNQVGGHSAIYKFTKRAVCKVSVCVRAMTFS